MTRPRTALLAFLTAGALALTGCGQAGGGGTATTAEGDDAPSCAEPAGGGRLSVATGNTTGV